MAKAYRIPDYRKMYPEAGEEVISLLRTTERKMQYQEYDLKTEQTIISQEDQTITTIPSEYSCAVKPHIRAGGNRQSGIQETVIASLLA